MIKPLFKHHDKSHNFVGQLEHKGDIYDIYTGECDEYGETLWVRYDNNASNFNTMPVCFIGGGGMSHSVLESAKKLLMAKRSYSSKGKKLSSLNELI